MARAAYLSEQEVRWSLVGRPPCWCLHQPGWCHQGGSLSTFRHGGDASDVNLSCQKSPPAGVKTHCLSISLGM